MALYFDGQTTLDSEQYDAIAYYRLSKDDGENKISESIENQMKLIREYVGKSNDLEG